MDEFSVPDTPAELTRFLIHTGLMRAYFDFLDESQDKRLTEHDIAVIESRALDVIGETIAIAQKFRDVEMEKSAADATAGLRELFEAGKQARLRKNGAKISL